ncbi:response regulator [Gilvimarinus sp. F26214L]|uniref:response regulator n=1 Tax=Gilvimarinus sp. DZF01 TaxID=3461371 RepID=UPI0040453069
MHKPELSLFHHPTTTIFVDDSEEFLYSIALGVDRLPYRSFSDPSQALSYVNQFADAYDVPAHARPPSASASVSNLLAQVERKLNDPHRFAEPSVLVVDYSMPAMNGLDLFSQITNPNVKKVLLTGVADEKVAIDALNTDLIDFYISKRESSLAHRLRNILFHLETRYFQDLFGWSRDVEVRAVLPHLFDTAFADFFEDTLETMEAVEHYPLQDTAGFCLINSFGETSDLVVYSEEDLERMLAQTDTSALSSAGLKALTTRKMIPGPLKGTTCLRDNNLFAPTVIEGSRTWYCAFMKRGHLHDGNASRTTYHQFLKTPLGFSEELEFSKKQ